MPNIKARMQDALDSSAVLKMKFIALRGKMPEVAIFAFEGVDDKSVYYHWIKQLASDLNYVPFLCGGKRSSLKLMSSLDRDVNGLRQGVYFCIDRDFDKNPHDMRGVYVTDSYSFENHLACTDVLEQILKNDFHLHADPDAIQYICQLYGNLEKKFFEIVCEINLVLFVAANLKIRRIKKLPDKIGYLARVDIDGVESKIEDIFELVVLERRPTAQEIDDKREMFNALSPRGDYRGKFNILFFKKFLELIYQELNNPKTDVFKSVKEAGLSPRLNLTLDTIASRSNAPRCFSKFVHDNFVSKTIELSIN